eukprot:7501874-Alexandrium_andersonii.AAC.1
MNSSVPPLLQTSATFMMQWAGWNARVWDALLEYDRHYSGPAHGGRQSHGHGRAQCWHCRQYTWDNTRKTCLVLSCPRYSVPAPGGKGVKGKGEH